MNAALLQNQYDRVTRGHLRPGTGVTTQIYHLQYGPLKSWRGMW